MPPATLLEPSLTPRKSSLPAILSHRQGDHPLSLAVSHARSSLAAYIQAPAEIAAWDNLVSSLRMTCVAIAGLPRGEPDKALLESTIQLVREVIAAGAHERIPGFENDPHAVAKGWPRLLIYMLLRPAWACPEAPSLDVAPEWLRDAYAEWLFAVPETFIEPGQADRYAAFAERQLAELVRWVEANPGAAVVKVALEHYNRRTNFRCLMLSTSLLRRHAELHARLITRAAAPRRKVEAPIALPRDGRRLRLGFVVPAFDGSMEMKATLPLISHLDPDRFEHEVFVYQSVDTRWEAHARQCSLQMQVLPGDLDEQVETISRSFLDVLIFAGEIAGADSDLARLAARRICPLQVVSSAHQKFTTGLPTVDLFLLGDRVQCPDHSSQTAERTALVWGSGRVVDDRIAAEEAVATFSRPDLNIPADALVLTAATDWQRLTAETQHVWARLLAQLPGSVLVVQCIETTQAAPSTIARHCAPFDRTLSACGVASDRLIVIPVVSPTHDPLQSLFAVGDVFLDALPSNGSTAVCAALKAGLPVVTQQSAVLRTGYVAAELRSLGLEELVALDEESYQTKVMGLANDAGRRAALREKIAAAMADIPVVFDSLAACDAFSDVVEVAFDELILAGREAFRMNRSPIRVAADSVSPAERLRTAESALASEDYFEALNEARQALRSQPNLASARAVLGSALLALEQPARAVEYLLPSVEAADADAKRWFKLAQALRQNGQGSEAVQALQTCLQLDPRQAGGWLLLIEIAEELGAIDIAQEALGALKQHVPEHPEAFAITDRLNLRERELMTLPQIGAGEIV